MNASAVPEGRLERSAAAPSIPAARPPLGLGRASLVIGAVLALFFLPALIYDAQFLYRDSGRLHHAVRAWIAAELRHGHLPQWNPWGGLGYPMVAGAVDAVQHPFNALFLLLPFEAAFKAWVLLSFLMGGTGSFAWARRLGLGFGPALAAGLGFALSGFLVSSTDNLTYLSALAALPWILAASHAWLEDGGPGRLALLGVASAVAAAAGDPQSWGLTVGALPLYGACLAPARGEGALRGAVRGALAALACAIAAAPFLLPVIAWIPHSSRGEAFDAFEYERWNLLPFRAAELFVPHLLRDGQLGIWSELYETYSGSPYTPLPWVLSEYVGAAGLALALLGACRSRAARGLLALAGLGLWVAMGSNAGFGQLARQLPVLSGFRYWEKAAVFVHLLVPVAAGYGLAVLGERGAAARRFLHATAGAAAMLLAAHAAAAAFPSALAGALVRDGRRDLAELLAANVSDGALHAGLALALLALAAWLALRGRASRLAAALAVAVVVGDAAAANVRAYALFPYDIVGTAGPIADRVARSGGERLLTPFSLGDPAGPAAARSGTASRQAVQVAWALGARSLASGFNVGVAGNFEAYTGMVPARQMRFRRRAGLHRQLPAAGMWSVAWLVVPGDPRRAAEMGLPPPYRVAAADPEMQLALVEVGHRPRAYLAADVASVDRRRAMEFALDSASVSSSRSVVEGPLPPGYRPPRGEVRIVRDEPEHVVLEATSDIPGLVVLNDGYADGWRAAVDGRPAEILPANYMARGVWIGAGTHAVAFTYRTPMLLEGWAVSLAGAIALVLWALARSWRRGAPAPEDRHRAPA